ncbi:WecB/TagA/CpsF family glycosyltransferase [Nosocomiicoccus ampullae]|uniref:WecB/TagA/CpsF family glycosyltransferase n=1 Tax=Nosocomiicoccus ampullae TaxID=489910 RepID=UPI00254BFF6B|nr:WecB/TagA/CpsF family glycosyltransferase [Nosocomiicoccus ampullae]MDK6863355.1 WecB/TagA/CpsF family glycosyltransferase [Nosocomiicoccus ampullae]
MIKRAVHLLGIPFVNTTHEQFVDELKRRLEQKEKTFVVTANPEILMKTKEDNEFQHVVKRADYVTPDGIGVVLLSKLKRRPLKERITGFDLTVDLLQYADDENLSVYLLGAKESVNKEAAKQIQSTYPNLNIVGRHHGYIDIDDEKIHDEIYEQSPDIVFVALGAPKQELFIDRHIKNAQKGLFIGVGGSLDVHAKAVKRAPDIWIKLNLEWLYRMIKQPERIKRNIKVFSFMIKTLLKND